MLCLLVDYIDVNGNDFHRALQVVTYNKYLSLAFIIQEVTSWRCTLSAVRLFHGFYTGDELNNLAEKTDLPSNEMLYINPFA